MANEKSTSSSCIKTGWISSEGRFDQTFRGTNIRHRPSIGNIAISPAPTVRGHSYSAVAAAGIGPGDESHHCPRSRSFRPPRRYPSRRDPGARRQFPHTWNIGRRSDRRARSTPATRRSWSCHIYGTCPSTLNAYSTLRNGTKPDRHRKTPPRCTGNRTRSTVRRQFFGFTLHVQFRYPTNTSTLRRSEDVVTNDAALAERLPGLSPILASNPNAVSSRETRLELSDDQTCRPPSGWLQLEKLSNNTLCEKRESVSAGGGGGGGGYLLQLVVLPDLRLPPVLIRLRPKRVLACRAF